MNAKLGWLERVDLREHWTREDTNFTPWLAQEENTALLGEAIGVELEVQDQGVQCTAHTWAEHDITTADGRAAALEWHLSTLEAFERVFRKRVKALDASKWQGVV